MRVADVMIARAKRIYILIIKVNKLFSSFSSRCFLKEIENMYSVFLSSYRNTRESFGELEKAVETLVCGSCSHSISLSPKVSNKVHVFYFLSVSSLFVLIGLENPPCSRRGARVQKEKHVGVSRFDKVADVFLSQLRCIHAVLRAQSKRNPSFYVC